VIGFFEKLSAFGEDEAGGTVLKAIGEKEFPTGVAVSR